MSMKEAEERFIYLSATKFNNLSRSVIIQVTGGLVEHCSCEQSLAEKLVGTVWWDLSVRHRFLVKHRRSCGAVTSLENMLA